MFKNVENDSTLPEGVDNIVTAPPNNFRIHDKDQR